MSYSKALKELKFDVRMREFNLSNKVLSPDEVKNFEASLTDSSANAEILEIEVEHTIRSSAPQAPMQTAVDFGGLGGFGSGSFGGSSGGNGFTF